MSNVKMCVCDFEEHGQWALSEALKKKEKLEDLGGQSISLTGHMNQAGGICCPHYGNTCGHCPQHS